MSKSPADAIKMVEEMAYVTTRLFKHQDATDIISYFTMTNAIDAMIGCLWEPGNYNSLKPQTREFISKIVDSRMEHNNEMTKAIRQFLKENNAFKKNNLNDD